MAPGMVMPGAMPEPEPIMPMQPKTPSSFLRPQQNPMSLGPRPGGGLSQPGGGFSPRPGQAPVSSFGGGGAANLMAMLGGSGGSGLSGKPDLNKLFGMLGGGGGGMGGPSSYTAQGKPFSVYQGRPYGGGNPTMAPGALGSAWEPGGGAASGWSGYGFRGGGGGPKRMGAMRGRA